MPLRTQKVSRACWAPLCPISLFVSEKLEVAAGRPRVGGLGQKGHPWLWTTALLVALRLVHQAPSSKGRGCGLVVGTGVSGCRGDGQQDCISSLGGLRRFSTT